MRYQTSLALLASAVSIVARPTSGYALNSALQKKEDKEKCFCFKLSDTEKTDVKCGRYVIPDKDDKDCNTFDTASARRCCDDGCNEHGCDKKGGLSFGYSADELGPHNSMIDGHGDLVNSEWKKAKNAALGSTDKDKPEGKKEDKEGKNKENYESDKKEHDDEDSDSDSDSDDDDEREEGED